MIRSTLSLQCHYIDVTGEIDVFEKSVEYDEEAKINNVVVMPGVGFDVVPSDCLSLYLAEKARGEGYEPFNLDLAFTAGGSMSRKAYWFPPN